MAAEGPVIACHTKEEFKAKMEEAVQAKKLVVIDFTAVWCGPCRAIAPVFAELAKKFTDVVFLKVDVDELKEVAAEYNIEAMPTFLYIKEGQVIDTVVGANKNGLQMKLESHSTATSSA